MNDKIDDGTLAYLAGLFEAEGNSSISEQFDDTSKHGIKHIASIELRMSDEQPIKLCHKYLGGYFGSEKRNKPRKTLYRWRITSKLSSVAAHKIFPFMLVERKKKAIGCIIEFADTINAHRGTTPLSLDELDKRKALYQKIKQLNEQGKGANNSLSLDDLSNFDVIPSIEYLAGVYEGDGGAGIKHANNYTSYACYLTLSMSDAECVKAFYNRFGGNLATTQMPNNSKTQFACRNYSKKASNIAKKLLPFIQTERKQKLLKCIIDFAETICERGIYQSSELKEYQTSLYEQCSKYNGQPIRNREHFDKEHNNPLQLSFL